MRAVRTVLVLVAWALLGALVGLLGAFQHGSTLDAGAALPIGLIAGLGALGLTLGLANAASGRGGTIAAAVAWLVGVTVLGTSRPAGDIVVPGDGRGAAYFWLGAVVCLVGSVLAGLSAARGQMIASGPAHDGR